jgi:Protein of unknown function (DUF3040)
MALPMDEQRILEEMERMLAADDPRLAARLAAFGQPGVGHVLRTTRARAVLSLLTLGVIACVAAVIYMVNVFHMTGTQNPPHTFRSEQSASARPGTSGPPRSLQANHATRPAATPSCAVPVAPGHCIVWPLKSASVTSHPSPSAGQPAKSASKAAKP